MDGMMHTAVANCEQTSIGKKMENQVIESTGNEWGENPAQAAFPELLEAGKVLYFRGLEFEISAGERRFFTPQIKHPKSRNISLDNQGRLAGSTGDAGVQEELGALLGRFRSCAQTLIHSRFPLYKNHLRMAPTSFRPLEVASRVQSVRADDRRLHIDAFPSRPNYGERILRVFINVNPHGVPRVWRVGEPFERIAQRYLADVEPYSRRRAQIINALGITKSLRSEYDHLMLKLHDAMKSDLEYQQNSPQVSIPFPSGAVWVCFSDQASHAVMSGQYMMEQTFHLPATEQYQPESSPLAILRRLTGRELVNS
ncbi:MAG: Kdo hydroxylase family protein [Rugosibacter sp.]